MTIMSVQNLWKNVITKCFCAMQHFLAHCDEDVKYCRPIRQEPNKNEILRGQGIWDETKSFLLYKEASVELKRAKTPVNQFFQSPTRRLPPTAAAAELGPKGRTVTSADIHKALAKIQRGFGLKRPSMSVPNLFFARPSPKLPSPLLFSIIGIGKGRHDVLPAP